MGKQGNACAMLATDRSLCVLAVSLPWGTHGTLPMRRFFLPAMKHVSSQDHSFSSTAASLFLKVVQYLTVNSIREIVPFDLLHKLCATLMKFERTPFYSTFFP